MIRKIVTVLVLLPVTALIAMVAVANRAPVTVAFDPFGTQPPMLSAALPLFLLLLLTLIAGVIVGGIASWMRQAKWRRYARRLAADLKISRAETDALRRQLEASAATQAQAQSVAAIAYRHSSAA
jgi:uncharacterized integral membrane protein